MVKRGELLNNINVYVMILLIDRVVKLYCIMLIYKMYLILWCKCNCVDFMLYV